MKTKLVNSIMNNLKIEKDIFSVGMIEDCLDGINPKQYKEFFNMLMGDEHNYLKPLDRVAKVAKHFKGSEAHEKFKDVPTLAKEAYDKFYSVNCSMTTYSQENRDKVLDDRLFFIDMVYSKLLDKNNFKVFTEQNLYILNELGGGEWLMNIRFITNSKDAISKIENIISNAITKKYLTPSGNAIAHNVRKLLK